MLIAEKVTRQNTDPPSWAATMTDGRTLMIDQHDGAVVIQEKIRDPLSGAQMYGAGFDVAIQGDGVLDYCELRVALEGVLALPEVED